MQQTCSYDTSRIYLNSKKTFFRLWWHIFLLLLLFSSFLKLYSHFCHDVANWPMYCNCMCLVYFSPFILSYFTYIFPRAHILSHIVFVLSLPLFAFAVSSPMRHAKLIDRFHLAFVGKTQTVISPIKNENLSWAHETLHSKNTSILKNVF